ncbi:hypothetical protein QNN00_03865 [Bacillus velezensis]|nr:hypothetical protein [Bacillus velezensis]
MRQAAGCIYFGKSMRVLIVMDVIESWAGMIWIGSVSLTYVHDVLHKGEAWWGYVNGVYYAGTMIGGLIIYKLSGKFQHHLIPLMLTGALAYGMFTFIYGLITSAVTALFWCCVWGRLVYYEISRRKHCFKTSRPKRHGSIY